MKQTVQIIGGQFRGKKLQFPEIEGLRPTPNRVRETLFNWLMHDIRDAHCLDAFAGSGALGFEAFSRGAEVTLLEKDQLAFRYLQKSALSFQSTKLKVIKTNALTYFHETRDIFDIIFLDPPFLSDALPECLASLTSSNVLKIGGLIYIESPVEIIAPTANWQPLKLKKAGQIIYGLYKKQESA
ncbi:MAG: 16S rRNA (guanine(966)-N(2))-methyltransferase RsmD [Legionellales bacterium]|nr:16S rRNA (guanine(966)-N(2))-methyltransferase RsmD [Legionellales bacterium]